jgi:hypothetical protein
MDVAAKVAKNCRRGVVMEFFPHFTFCSQNEPQASIHKIGTFLRLLSQLPATSWPRGWKREQIAGESRLSGWGGIPQDIADNDTAIGFDFFLGNREKGAVAPTALPPVFSRWRHALGATFSPYDGLYRNAVRTVRHVLT